MGKICLLTTFSTRSANLPTNRSIIRQSLRSLRNRPVKVISQRLFRNHCQLTVRFVFLVVWWNFNEMTKCKNLSQRMRRIHVQICWKLCIFRFTRTREAHAQWSLFILRGGPKRISSVAVAKSIFIPISATWNTMLRNSESDRPVLWQFYEMYMIHQWYVRPAIIAQWKLLRICILLSLLITKHKQATSKRVPLDYT